ncbi:M55 family metallopeptidase [candidate division KSB1 bacterium]
MIRNIALIVITCVMSMTGVYAQGGLKVFISVDMEGITGVVNSDHVSSAGQDYGRFRKIMTEETNAAVLGALDAGATEIVVNDSHGGMRNILIEELHSAADLISGSPKHLSMMEGIDDSYDAVIFIGYHAAMGTQNATLDHTMSSARLANVFINGARMNEASLNAYLAGYYGVPVVFVAGDRNFVRQAHELIGPELEAAAVKDAVGRQAARNLSVERAHELIREGVRKGIEGRAKMPVKTVTSPVKLEMEFLRSDYADQLDLVPGVTRVSGRKVVYTGNDYLEVFRLMRALLALSGT